MKDRWTILLLREGPEAVRQFSIPARIARAAALGAGIVVIGLVASTTFLALGGSSRVQARVLAEENSLLEEELGRIQVRLAEVDEQLGALAESDERVRLLAGMTGIDEEVFEVGVGGPGLDSPENSTLWVLDREASEAAYAVRYDLEVLERRMSLLGTSMDAAAESMTAQRKLLEATPSILPTAGLLSSGFSGSRFHPILHRWTAHEGVDIHAVMGTPILAAADGIVKSSGRRSGYGQTVEIDHGYGYVTLYAHASKLLVSKGQRVKRGQVIAQVGRTGLATAPNLHYEVHVAGRPVNPMNYVLRGAVP